ncbi:alpha/beta hydrolase [Mesorhizobium sp. CAU 1741]|uniref:alpha/beta hydrolase n=1 Tax=Mesorhizobium sp. CAU 1741 TaxID=3140366 RepID=UPI00325BDC49
MPSFKSHLYAFVLKHTRKKAFASAEGLHAWIAKSRPTQDHRPPIKVAARLRITVRTVEGCPVYEVRPKSGEGTRRMLYLHGGAYCFEMTSFHWRLVAELVERLDAHVTVPIYPLAPEHQFNAIYGMVRAVYRDVMAEGSEVALAGDSAGGNMALVLTMMAAEEGWPLPRRLALISPGVDMTLQDEETHAVARIDPWLGIEGGRESVRIYAGGLDFSDWRISPRYGDLTALPPTLVLSGTRDLLHPDTLTFVQRAKTAGADVELVVGQGMIHVWPLLDMPETRPARDRIVEFLRR